jgi:hypothetical protein
MKRYWLVLLFALVAASASAQSVVNPTRVTYDPSPDDAIVFRYEIGYFYAGAAEPFFVSDLGKPVCAPTCSNLLPAKPVFSVNLIAKVRAFGQDAAKQPVASVWSEPSNPFDLLPAAPANPSVAK